MGDITHESTDAIVNAANEHLAHSGGCAASITQAGGFQIQIESNNLVAVNGPIKTGECTFTSSGKLSENGIKYVIHAVGPEYNKQKSALYNASLLYQTVYNTL